MKRILLLAALVAAACQAPPDKSGFWTTRDFVNAVHGGYGGKYVTFAGIAASAVVVLAGAAVPLLSTPYSAQDVLQESDSDGLAVIPAFAEGKPAAYLINEVWYDWPPIWVQPVYVPVTAWDSANPSGKLVPGAHVVFSVGEHSTFYSPYWVVYWAVVPEGTPAEVLTNSKAVLDRATEMHEGPGALGSIVPAGVAQARAQGATASVRPLTLGETEDVQLGLAWAENELVPVMNYGTDRFEWDENGVVIEDPIFAFATLDAAGAYRMLDLPKVGGVGPYRSGQKGAAPGNKPRFGALWRVYTALVPATAGVFVPSTMEALRQKVLAGGGVTVPAIDPAIEARADAADYVLRVALAPACFANPAAFPGACQFLDSQEALETLLSPQSIERTLTTVNCPFVEYAGQKVPYQ